MTVNMFEGDRVRLRGTEPDDWTHFQRWDADTDASRFGWMVHAPRGSEAAKKFAQEASAAAALDDDNRRFIIETLDGVPVGSLNTHGCSRLHRRFEYGIALDREQWGKGYAEDALVVLLRFMFEERGYHKVNAWVYAFNERSRRMHEKFGMTLEGRIREAHFTGGAFHDVVVFGMTASEFAARHPGQV